jgi:tetratricopeptide (TPR) repeat protein
MSPEENAPPADSLKEQGIRMFRLGEYAEATESFLKARESYQKMGDQKGRAEMLNNLGAVYTQEERWSEAVEAFQNAQQIFQSLEDIDGRAQTLGNLGNMYRHQGDREAAVIHLKQAVELFHEAGDWQKEAATLRLISRIRMGQARWFEALHFYDLSLACVQTPGLKERVLRWLIRVPFNILSRPS